MPAISGVHHVTFVVGALDAGISWFTRIFCARHVPRFDHHDASGALFGVILELPGFLGSAPAGGFGTVPFQEREVDH